jgi:hypothetical protein
MRKYETRGYYTWYIVYELIEGNITKYYSLAIVQDIIHLP